jgi:RNA polymerase sigma-70 factor (ECF subfamily)
MAENLVLDRSRASHRRFRRESEWTNGQVDGSLANAIDARPSTERVLMARDYLRHVNTALETLPEPTVIAFRAVRIDGTPQKQVAAMLGISLSAVEKHLQRAYRMIAALKLRLDAETPAPRRHTIERIDDGH